MSMFSTAWPNDDFLVYSSPRAIIPTSCIHDIPYSDIKTQKARGIKALANHTIAPMVQAIGGYEIRLLPQNNTMPPSLDAYKLFARPCPVTPRHGFVESRAVADMVEAQALLIEARQVDPEAEVIVMKKLTGKWSGIATNTGVTWGHGNDGVTSGGKGAVVLIPAPTSVENWNSASLFPLRGDFKASITQTGYVELVENEGRSIVVQYREGPAQPATLDYIPRKTLIKSFLVAGGDLLKWEKRLSGIPLADRKTTVISAKGMALSSHYAVHGIALGIPVVTSDIPIVRGQTLEAAENTIPKLRQKDYQTLATLLKKALKAKFNFHQYEQQEVLATGIASLHTMAVWDNSPMLMELRALSVVTILRYLCSAVVGEVRHFDRKGPGQDGLTEQKTIVPSDRYENGRDFIYSRLLKPLPLATILSYFQTTQEDFFQTGWGVGHSRDPETGRSLGRWDKTSASYGGPNWGRVSRSGERLAKATIVFLEQPNKQTWQELFMSLNNAVHMAHNNGRALDKWIGDSMLDRIAQAPALGFMNAYAAEIALGIVKKEGSE